MCFKWTFLTLSVLVVLSGNLCICKPKKRKDGPISPGEAPYLLLLQIKTSSVEEDVSGCLVSMSWALALSSSLALLPSGPLPSNVTVLVHAGLSSLDLIGKAPSRQVLYIDSSVTGPKMMESNSVFPNFVLLKLKEPFERSKLIQPITLNIGWSPGHHSTMIGWAHTKASRTTLTHAVSTRIRLAGENCEAWALVDYSQQMCGYEEINHSIRLVEGSLLVDQGFLTGLMQFYTYYKSPASTHVVDFVRMREFVAWIQHVVAPDPMPDPVFLNPKVDKSITRPPNGNPRVSGGILRQMEISGGSTTRLELLLIVLTTVYLNI